MCEKQTKAVMDDRPDRLPSQWWFWTPEWQAGERLVDEELRTGQYEVFDNMDDFLASLGETE